MFSLQNLKWLYLIELIQLIFTFTCLPSHKHLIFLPAIHLCFCCKPSLLLEKNNLWKEINVQCELVFLTSELHFQNVTFLHFNMWITPAHLWKAFLHMWISHCWTFSHLTVHLIFSHLETKHWTTITWGNSCEWINGKLPSSHMTYTFSHVFTGDWLFLDVKCKNRIGIEKFTYEFHKLISLSLFFSSLLKFFTFSHKGF